ncbi:MAG: pitrilysin family protein [Candidatus Aenigmatarchaeota archaeon]
MNKFLLDNNLKIYTVKTDNKNIGIGIGVNVGSIYEEIPGISHFLEHMMFKSNEKYSSQQIDEGLELSGAISNAFTSTCLTFYFVETIPHGFNKIIDILFSMFSNEKFKEEEFEKEKKVILSEIERNENNPEDKLISSIPNSLFGNSDYGRSIIGNRESIESITKIDLEEFKEKYYSANNMFILLEGNFNKKHIDLVIKYFSKLENKNVKLKKPTKSKGKDIYLNLHTQNQIYFALNRNYKIEEFFDLEALSSILSGGISSKLFQIFRSKYGIGYVQQLENTYIYPDEIIFSLLIPGFEKEKEKLLKKAISEIINNYSEYINGKYVNGRIKRQKLVFEKIKNNLFKKIYYDALLIKLFDISFEQFEKIIFTKMKNYEKLEKYLKSLEKGNRVIIYPK